jgi:hypothetical protein
MMSDGVSGMGIFYFFISISTYKNITIVNLLIQNHFLMKNKKFA